MSRGALRKEAMPPFAFIVGRGRSGTTLVRAMLTSHSDLAIPLETHFIVPLSLDRRLVSPDLSLAVAPFLRRLRRQPGFKSMGLDDDVVDGNFAESPPADYPNAIRRLFALYAQSEGKRRYGDKTPIHVLHIEYLARLFPEAKFIHVIRDGRNVALSYLETDFGPGSLWEGAIDWRRFVRSGRRAGQALGEQRYREIRYEDLIEDPQTHMMSLCEFVGLDFEEEMLLYFERAEKLGSNGTHHRNLRRPPTRNLRDWRQQLTAADVALFEVLAGDLLSELGYERATPQPGLPARTRAVAKRLTMHGRRTGRGLRRRTKRLRKSFQAV